MDVLWCNRQIDSLEDERLDVMVLGPSGTTVYVAQLACISNGNLIRIGRNGISGRS